MVSLAAGVRPYPTASILEARIRELRDIRELAPPYNSASTRQGSQHWVIAEAGRPRVVSSITLGDLPHALGPFGTRAHALRAAGAIERVLTQAEPDVRLRLLDEAVAASSLAVPARSPRSWRGYPPRDSLSPLRPLVTTSAPT